MPPRHGDIPNAYVNADTQKKMDIYLGIPQGMEIFDSVLVNFKVTVKRIWHFDC